MSEMTDEELIEFYIDHKEHHIDVCSFVNFSIKLKDLVRLIRLLDKYEENDENAR